jgi:hypothetical protein
MKKLLTVLVAALVVSAVSVRPVAASSNPEKEVRFAAKVKLKGYISEISENEFVVTDVKTGASKNVAYAEVKQIKGNNMSTGAKIAIGVSVAIGLILLISWLIVAGSD